MGALEPANTPLEYEEANYEDDNRSENREGGRTEVGNGIRHEGHGG